MAYDYGTTTPEERARDIQTMTVKQLAEKYSPGATASAASTQPAQQAPATQSNAGTTTPPSSGPSGASSSAGSSESGRDYGAEALSIIRQQTQNGIGFEGGAYADVLRAYNNRGNKIAASPGWYASRNVSQNDAVGQEIKAYLDRYANAYATYQQEQANRENTAAFGGGATTLAQQAALSAEGQKLQPVDIAKFTSWLDQWKENALRQSNSQTDFAVQQGVNELQRTQEDAEKQFQQQRNQIEADAARGADNAALYAQGRGDRGGIGQAQYDAVQAARATNLQTVRTAQTQLATDIARQIADLRAQGEFQKADDALSIAQSYLSQMFQLQQWGIETNLSIEQFNAQVDQWLLSYQADMEQLGISVQQWATELQTQIDQFNRTFGYQQEQDILDRQERAARYERADYESDRAYEEDVRRNNRDYTESVRQADRSYDLQVRQFEESLKQWADEYDLRKEAQRQSSEQFWSNFNYGQDMDRASYLWNFIQGSVEKGIYPGDAVIDTLGNLIGISPDKDAIRQEAETQAAMIEAGIQKDLKGTSGTTTTGVMSVTSDSYGRAIMPLKEALEMAENGTISENAAIALFNGGYDAEQVKDLITDEDTKADDLRDPESGLQRKYDRIDGYWAAWQSAMSMTENSGGLTYENSGGGGALSDRAFESMRSQLTSLLRQGDDDSAGSIIGNMAKYDLTDQQKRLIAQTVQPYFSNFLRDNPYFEPNSTEGSDSSSQKKVSSPSGISITANKDYHDLSKENPYDSNVSDSHKYSLSQEGNMGALKSDGTRSKYFTVREFASKDVKGSTDIVYIDPELVDVLDMIREHFGQPVTLNSGYRTWNHNITELGNKTEHSMHMYGRAADIVVKNTPIKDVYNYVNSILPDSVGGIGQYNASGFVHVDVRSSGKWRTRSAN